MNFNNLKKIQDWYFPKTDSTMWDYLNSKIYEPGLISKYCDRKRVCLQAGGNIGWYPKAFSKLFDRVITFEPDKTNFDCLVLNTLDCDNITKFQCGIGLYNGGLSLERDNLENCGSYHFRNLKQGTEISMISIDNLVLKELDLLCLDLEGFETFACLGGIKTIVFTSPVICVETGCSEVSGILSNIGYQKVDQIDVNAIWKRRV